ncbi:MAG: hypothetical protein QOG99_2728 [Frankiales bacterium]|nr:hypothetical protein [Frankiales bacterium]
MLPLGLLLVVAAGVVGVAVVLDNTDATSVSAFGTTLDTTTAGVFLAGAAAGLVLMLGLAMMSAGARRRRTKRRAAKAQVREARTEADVLAEENARLRAQVTASTDSTDSTVTDSGDPYPTATEATSGRHANR